MNSPRSPCSGPTAVASVLSTFGVTKRKLKKLDLIASAKHPQHHFQRAYSARPFVLCGIPVRRPHNHILEYSRHNGRFRLRVIGHPDYGLPLARTASCAYQKSDPTRNH